MDWQEVAAIVAFVTLVVLIIGLIWKGSGTISVINTKVDANTISAAATNAELDVLRSDFSRYQVQAAKEFASISAITEIRREIQTGFHDVQSRLDRAFVPAMKG